MTKYCRICDKLICEQEYFDNNHLCNVCYVKSEVGIDCGYENYEHAENWEQAKHGWVCYCDGNDNSLVTLNPDVFFDKPKKKTTKASKKYINQWFYPKVDN